MNALTMIDRIWKPSVIWKPSIEAGFGRGHRSLSGAANQELMQTSTRLTTWRPAATGRIAS